MKLRVCLLLCACLGAVIALAGRRDLPFASAFAKSAPEADPKYSLHYSADGALIPPANYRQWIFLTSGFNMSYTAESSDSPVFDNVFVDPTAYRAFLATGAWPDKTVLVLESRNAANKGSINRAGHFQRGTVGGLELHVKDESRFPGKWAFFEVESPTRASLFPAEATCYSCHRDHAAADTTFVQFYPTLLPVATAKGTISIAYQKEEAAESR